MGGSARKYVSALAIVLGTLLIHSFIWLMYRDCPKPQLYRVSLLKGRVVGKNLGPVQYRWLRRMFSGTQASLTLFRIQGSDVGANELVRRIYANDFGYFDFGPIDPGDYELQVELPGSPDSFQRFLFAVDPKVRNSPLLIDDSSPGRWTCRGHDVEYRQQVIASSQAK